MQLAEHGFDFPTVAAQAGKPDADLFDLLCFLAFSLAGLDVASARSRMLTRRQWADRLKRQRVAMFNYIGPEACEILDDLLEAVDMESTTFTYYGD